MRETHLHRFDLNLLVVFDAIMREYCYQRNSELRISLGRELTIPALAQSVVLTRVSGRASPMPAGETLSGFGATGATLAIHFSGQPERRSRTAPGHPVFLAWAG